MDIEGIGKVMMSMALDNLERDGYVALACILISKQDEAVPFLPVCEDEQSKVRLAQMLRAMAAHCRAIVIISEAWTLSDPEVIATITTSVSEHPQKNESVFVQVESKESSLLLTSSFTRDVAHKPIRPTKVHIAWQTQSTAIQLCHFQNLFRMC